MRILLLPLCLLQQREHRLLFSLPPGAGGGGLGGRGQLLLHFKELKWMGIINVTLLFDVGVTKRGEGTPGANPVP